MATLDAFLIRGKKKTTSLSSSQDTHIQHAFVNPFTVQVKKPSVPLGNKAPTEKPTKQSKRNTIAHYFTPAIRDTADVDVDMQDATDVCVIRNKIPVANLWDMIQYELDQDPFYNDIMDESSATIATTTTTLAISSNCIKRRRSRQSDTEQNSKRLRKTDQELSSIMARFLNMGSMIKQRPMLSSLDLMNEFSEDMEDLSRPVRHKQTSQASHLFLYHITQEFLDFAINQ